MTESTLGKTRADMASAEEAARETLAAARDETSQLQKILEGQRHKIEELEAANTGRDEYRHVYRTAQQALSFFLFAHSPLK